MLIKDGPRWSWQGAVAVTLATGIFVSITITCSGVAWKMAHGRDLAPVTVNLLTATLSALVGAVATFLGKVARPSDDRPPEPGAVIDRPVDLDAGLDQAPAPELEPEPPQAAVAEPGPGGDDDTVIRPVTPPTEGEPT